MLLSRLQRRSVPPCEEDVPPLSPKLYAIQPLQEYAIVIIDLNPTMQSLASKKNIRNQKMANIIEQKNKRECVHSLETPIRACPAISHLLFIGTKKPPLTLKRAYQSVYQTKQGQRDRQYKPETMMLQQPQAVLHQRLGQRQQVQL